MAKRFKFYHPLPRTIEQAKASNDWNRGERLEYLRNRSRASNHIHKMEIRTRVFERDGYKCVYCGSADDLTIDHIIPICRGGNNDDCNLQTLCRSCNSRKPN